MNKQCPVVLIIVLVVLIVLLAIVSVAGKLAGWVDEEE